MFWSYIEVLLLIFLKRYTNIWNWGTQTDLLVFQSTYEHTNLNHEVTYSNYIWSLLLFTHCYLHQRYDMFICLYFNLHLIYPFWYKIKIQQKLSEYILYRPYGNTVVMHKYPGFKLIPAEPHFILPWHDVPLL